MEYAEHYNKKDGFAFFFHKLDMRLTILFKKILLCAPEPTKTVSTPDDIERPSKINSGFTLTFYAMKI